MSMMSGTFRYTLDPKNRIFIPAKFREMLGEDIIITKDIRGRRLKVCSESTWNEYLAPILAKDRRTAENAVRILMRDAANVTPDSQGRIVLSPALIDYAGVSKDVVIVGCYHWAEIWSADEYDRYLAQEEEQSALVLQALEADGL